MTNDPDKRTEKHIVIKITPRLIERALFFLIIVILAAIIIFQMSSDGSENSNSTDDTTTTTEATTTTAADSGATTTTRTATTTQPLATLDDPATTAELKDNVEIVIVGEPQINEKGKVERIDFKITNDAMGSFIPKVEVLWYDSSSAPQIKNLIRGTWSFAYGIKGQSEKTGYLTLFESSYVDKADDDETFVVKVYNMEDGELLDMDSKTLTGVS